MLSWNATADVPRRAVLAPSCHNTQRRRFRAAENAIDLLADCTRALPVNDPDDRELLRLGVPADDVPAAPRRPLAGVIEQA